MAKHVQTFDSRQDMVGRNFEVFHYLDLGRRDVELHHHDFYEIYYFISGDVEYRVEGQSYYLQNGDLLLIDPWVFHQPVVQPELPYERFVIWIERGYLAQFTGEDGDIAACFGSGATLLRPSQYQCSTIFMLLEQLLGELRGHKYGSALLCQGLFLQLMTQINRIWLGTSRRSFPASEPEPDLAGKVLVHIASHFHEKLTLQELADTFFVSKYHLSHEFSSKVGTSVYRYIMLKRLMAAREQMAAGVSPTRVYQSCGFQDYANFYRAFKAEYGISPKEFAAQTAP